MICHHNVNNGRCISSTHNYRIVHMRLSSSKFANAYQFHINLTKSKQWFILPFNPMSTVINKLRNVVNWAVFSGFDKCAQKFPMIHIMDGKEKNMFNSEKLIVHGFLLFHFTLISFLEQHLAGVILMILSM